MVKGKWGIGEVGKWGSGEVGKWGSGEVGNWGSGGNLPITLNPTFRTLVVEIKSCSSPCIVRLLAITKNYEVSHSSQRSP
ncbi:MAG: hypothetical protein EWV67_05505, partial [Microcystis sp. M_QC_C_20170808_M2Col]